MAYDRIETAAYRLRLPADLPGLLGELHAFSFPDTWPDVIRQVWEHDARSHDPQRKLPVYGVNRAIRSLVPDVVHAGSELERDGLNTWLYARRPMDTGLLKRVVQSWLLTKLDAKTDYPRLRDAVNALGVDAHATDWRVAGINPDGIGVNDAGTATIDPTLYRLIPEVVAARILERGPFDGELTFIQVASDEGAELVSWPPQSYVKGRGSSARIEYYSAVLTIVLRTMPFDPAPRLHLAVSTRRWVSNGKLFVPPRFKPSVYVKPIADPATGFQGTRLARAALTWDRASREYRWHGSGPAGVLKNLTLNGKFPDAARIKNDPGAYLPPSSSLEAAVTFHTRMGRHAVQPGVMPDERRRILTWAAEALPEAFEPALQLEKLSLGKAPRQLVGRQSRDDAQRVLEVAADARVHRTMLAHGMQGEELRVDVITDTTEVREALVAAAQEWLGLAPCDAAVSPDHVLFEDGGLRVRLVCHEAGRLTDNLGDGITVPKRGAAHMKAIDDRAKEVCDFFQRQELTTELALVEITGRDDFATSERRKDPYRAIRQGAARAGRVTQFISSDSGDDLAFRAAAAWADGIRSLGIGLATPYAADLGLPEQIDQVAFWLVRRNVSSTVSKPVYMPIAVLARPEAPRVMARTLQNADWIPFNQMLCDLACADERAKELVSAKQQREEMGRFLRVVLSALRGRPLLLLTEAMNVRSGWLGMSDGGLRRDAISLGESTAIRLGAQNKQLRVVRVRTDASRLETPVWWTPPAKDGLSGFTDGLFRALDAGPGNRVFYSLAEKNGNLNKHPKAMRKFTRNGTMSPSPNKAAPVPRIVEIDVAGLAPSDGDDDAIAWAIFVHQQRFTEDYTGGRELPHVLDLCQKAGRYAFPESMADDESDDSVPLDLPDNEAYTQGTLDLEM